MKFIKKYEKRIKDKSTEALSNPLYDFSDRLVKLLQEVCNTLKNKSEANRYIMDNDEISIICKNTNRSIGMPSARIGDIRALKINFMLISDINDKIVSMVVERRGNQMIDFYDFLKLKLKKYITSDYIDEKKGYRFSIRDADKIIKIIEEYYIKLQANKYNI